MDTSTLMRAVMTYDHQKQLKCSRDDARNRCCTISLDVGTGALKLHVQTREVLIRGALVSAVSRCVVGIHARKSELLVSG